MKQSPTLKLALNIYNNPNVYALLLGAGISRSASIPTGWDITRDLVQKLAKLHNEEVDPDPETWYQKKFGQPLNYSDLLNNLTKTPAERMSLLRSYFEPTPEEQEVNLKTPTPAHRAIASLVKLGFIKVIITTNFDRLLEKALQDEGITPSVISSVDHLSGTMPYIHAKCTIIKIHGDYLDTRIRNTVQELEKYPVEFESFLDRVFDDFGLIVCGWSATWDIALRNAILRNKSRRFGYYWLTKGELSIEAKDIIAFRNAEVIDIETADEFFHQLLEKLESLVELNQNDPTDLKVLEATIKRFIPESRHRIRLHDLVYNELEKVSEALSIEKFPCDGIRCTAETVHQRMHQYEETVLRLIKTLSLIAYHDSGENSFLLTSALERLCSQITMGGYTSLLNLQYYSALLIEYATGISAIASKRFDNLAAILLKPKYQNRRTDEIHPTIKLLIKNNIFEDEKQIIPRPNAKNEYTPANNYLFELLRPILSELIPGEKQYQNAFDIFEYLLSLQYFDLSNNSWTTLGCFSWRYRDSGNNAFYLKFIEEGISYGDKWDLLKAGFFGGSVERLQLVKEAHTKFIMRILYEWGF
jgi:hypothetical protein